MRINRCGRSRCAILLVVILASAAAAQISAASPRLTQAVNEQNLTTLKGNTHPLAQARFDQGAAPDSLPMERMLLVLKRAPEQETALRQLMDDLHNGASPNFHKWLTPEEFGLRYGPADADLQVIKNWLTANGFQINRVAAGRTTIEFSGTAGQVRQAFHTQIHKYAVKGQNHWANASDPQIPVALTPVVAGIASLNNFPLKRYSRTVGGPRPIPPTSESVSPLLNTSSGKYAVGPTDFAIIYNVLPLWQAGIDGSSQSVAIVGRTNINPQDIRDFRSYLGLPPNEPDIKLNGPDPGIIIDDEGEALLDVEWAGAVARNASIKFVVSESTDAVDGILLSALYIVDNNIAGVMSVSYGNCEANLGSGANQLIGAVWEQAAAQGITVMVSAGDSGSAGCDDFTSASVATAGLAVSGFASTPFNVALGGTDFDNSTPNYSSTYWKTSNDPGTRASALSYIPETTWNDSCADAGLTGCSGTSLLNIVSGSGGRSAFYHKPTWQNGTGVPADGWRDLPDVSLFSGDGQNLSYYVVCQADFDTTKPSCQPGGYFLGVGGTSAAAPAFAGIMALVNHYQAQHGGSNRQGNANYSLYALAAQPNASCNSSASPGSSCIFYDTTKGNNSVPCAGTSPGCSSTTSGVRGILVDPAPSTPAYNTTAGYDLATGLGSVNAYNLATNWASVSFRPTNTTINAPATNLTITHGQAVNVSVGVAPQSGAGTPTGDIMLLGGPSSPLGIDIFTLTSGIATGATNLLPGGTYNLTAHYAGDGTFAASDSTPISVTVNKENSQTLVRLETFDNLGAHYTPTSAAYGSPYVLRIDVGTPTGIANAAISLYGAPPCEPSPLGYSACATGTVNLTDNGSPLDLGSYTLNSLGFLEDQPIQLPAGSHALAAQYVGDNSFNPSSNSLTVTISKAVTAVERPVSDLTNVAVNTTVHLTTFVDTLSNGAGPTGTVTFFADGVAIAGTATLTPVAADVYGPAYTMATLATSFSSNGAKTITASYSGDGNYSSSGPSSGLSITVTGGPAADFGVTPNPASITVTAGQTGTTTLTVAPSNGFTGTVTFACTIPTGMTETTCSAPAANVTGTASVNSTLTVTTTAAHTVAGLRRGSTWYLASMGGLFAGVLLLGVPKRRNRRAMMLGLLIIAGLLVGFVGCGGGNSGGGGHTDPGTPKGTYSLTVTATSGTLSHNTNVSVTVQ